MTEEEKQIQRQVREAFETGYEAAEKDIPKEKVLARMEGEQA